ncbi:hypothetical protein [Serratia sp. NFX21]|uniref:hypothetical protein n=1 Tax=Serratia sp. NFX21 TaxID=3402279 RepID=UPI003AF35559
MERIPNNSIIIFSIGIINGITQFETNTEVPFYLFLGEGVGYAKLESLLKIGSIGGSFKLKDCGIKLRLFPMAITEIIPTKDNIPEDLIYHLDTILFNSRKENMQ